MRPESSVQHQEEKWLLQTTECSNGSTKSAIFTWTNFTNCRFKFASFGNICIVCKKNLMFRPLRYLSDNSKMSFVPVRKEFHTAFTYKIACKNNYWCPFLSFSMLPSLLKRIHTDIRVVPRLYCTGTRMSVSFWNENPNKLIQKLLVSNKLYSGIMWQPVWTSFLNKTYSDIV